MSRTPRQAPPQSPVALALSHAAGPCLVLDSALRVVASSASADELLGFAVPEGESAPRLLCGQAIRRPLAEALAAGTPVQAVIPRPRAPGADRLLRVRSVPLRDGNTLRGWLLLLEDVGESGGEGPVLFQGMWTQSPAMKEVFRIIERVAEDDATVLVRGETGAGKELVAQAIHALSPRRAGPLRALNCAALPPNLLESELFGHVRGAFTGAVRDAPGHVVLANHGTLFLDEVAELPLELQAKLLRVIETRAVLPVGAREPVPVDVRFVSATHRALRKEVEAGRFRADLMYRLRVIPIFLPPLRERRGDVALLCEQLFKEMNREKRRHIDAISPSALEALEHHDWPGNVRELKNVLAYAYAIGDGALLLPSDLPPELLGQRPEEPVVRAAAPEGVPAVAGAADDSPRSPEAERILHVLERTAGNRVRAAQILGLSRVTLWRRMRELGLVPPR
jgi:transcriptional regulator with PAS, ATPase and Fis domain